VLQNKTTLNLFFIFTNMKNTNPICKTSFLIYLIILCCNAKSFAQTFTGIGDTIPDTGVPIQFSINVNGLSPNSLSSIHGLKTICLNINHSYVGDLRARIISPDGTGFSLFSQVGGGGQNFVSTCFDSSATSSIASGSAPFTGTFRPIGNIGNVNNNQNGNGIWKIEMTDLGAVDTGKLINWSLTFAANAPTPWVLTSNIPIVVIHSNGNTISSGAKVNASMKLINNVSGINSVNDPGNEFEGNIGIRIRGSFSASLPQKPYLIGLYGASPGVDTNVSMLGMPSESDWILQATYNDRAFVRNKLMYHIWREMGHYGARSKYCEVVVDNEYLGVYLLMEKIKRDGSRVDISKLTSIDTVGDKLTGGYIFSHDYYENGWSSNYSPDSCTNRFYDFNYIYPKATNIVPKQENYIKNFIGDFENRIYGTNVNDSTLGYKPKIDMPSFVDYMLANEMAWNGDGYKKSMYFFKDRDSISPKMQAGPIWDFDWALKRMPWTPADYSGWYYSTPPCDGDVLFLPWWNVMMQDTIFKNMSRCRWEHHRQHSLHIDTINAYIDVQVNYLQQAQQRHFNTWQTLGNGTGTPEQTPYPTSLTEEIDTLKSIIKKRILWIDANLQGNCDTIVLPSIITSSGSIQFSIFPNPTKGNVVIKSNTSFTEINILDIAGRSMIAEKFKPIKSKSINLSNVPNGIYFVEIRQQSQMNVYKIVKEE
jgi:subtilisin-like proprotein convertase family protein